MMRRYATVPLMLVVLLVVNACTLPGPAAAPSEADPSQRIALTTAEAQDLLEAAVVAHAEEFTAYPMWAVVELAEPTRLRLLERASFRTRWRAATTVRVRQAPGAVSPPRSPGPQVQRQAEDAAQLVADLWTAGPASGLATDRRTRRRQRAFAEDVGSVWAALESTHVIEVKDGWLVLAQHTLAAPATYDLTSAVLLTNSGPRVLGSRISAR